ncbi:predicted protein [Histoplasma capsulatum G186AR]|uniref:Uncharacterized protein n=1 Tax=Ajellomyces capsulatus (strain G186AR / H82 / ATCC MYA-2454 / RMSCC 2432) TaxID=447093 RepID=C0NRM7_AJECG|nr:uncharacterized protein HCBG_05807 [Histoplasma capsulatum G186AR]EEH05543.1 predicted protein [Histoplasma capsulatum G186AR]
MAMQYEALVHPRASRRWEVGNRGHSSAKGRRMELWPSNGGQDSQKRAELVSFEGWYEGVGGKREGKGNNKGPRLQVRSPAPIFDLIEVFFLVSILRRSRVQEKGTCEGTITIGSTELGVSTIGRLAP